MKRASRYRTKVYTVIEVWRGFASTVHTFAGRVDAQLCAEKLSRRRNLDEDDVEIFETTLTPPGRRRRRLTPR